MAQHARPGKSFMEMLELILRHQRRPNDPFTPQLLMAIFWEESFFTNRKQERGSAIGFGQVEPAELYKLGTQQARDNGYAVDGLSKATRELSDGLAVTVSSCVLLHVFHAFPAGDTESRVRRALNAYGGVDYKGPSPLTREDRLRIIAGWRRCEEKLKALPFTFQAIAGHAGNLTGLEDRYLDALAQAHAFQPGFVFSQEPLVRVRDVLFPAGWSLRASPVAAAAQAGASAARPEAVFGGRPFVQVAGPGQDVPELAAGDLLVRASAGGRPRGALIRSAPAAAEAFFFEGVMAEPGPRGLYVEVAGRSAHPVAHRIADHAGRLAPGTRVLRPVAGDNGAAEGLSNDDLKRRRLELLGAITADDFNWTEVPLKDGWKVRVCCPIFKDDLFVPGTAAETWQLARRFQLLPLTRAVMDQTHNVAAQVPKQDTPASLFDFVSYSERLRKTDYYRQYGWNLQSGAHKLWVISSRGKSVNYGFYIPRRATDPLRCGPYLDPAQNVIQGLGTFHPDSHWDYSQLLQFMRGLTDPGGRRVDLRQAVQDRVPAVWDEPAPPAPGSLP